ncbi:LysR substrate-binding domain-containing protein [Gallaecimonas xiamenensis]|uniref:LysR family transcriptional regulator n=1 Tax=Gallaecimonas xiamenensis 3-C-1 TaxID=745411 RepID=K2J9Z9_9GAMM|nr:LysR substrate-binding domain-containing protein [Gallaecimonas xiamenensis]EKE71627.1 LysR family transcriptional regulator [Gallaecimonas xiamenensis 3-C-1]
MPSFKQLQVFASVARHGNLGQAAEELFLSKGAVSQALGELERRLGTPLFDRVHPRLQLNDQGRQLQPLAEAVLDRVQDIRHLFDEGGEPQGELRLGASQTIGNYLLPGLLAQMPGLAAKVRITNTHNLCHLLAHFELDLALIEGENHHSELATAPWLDDEMLVVAASGHPLAGRTSAGTKLALNDLNGQHWVLREPQSGSREQFDRELAPRLGTLGRVLELNTLEAVMQGVEAGLGLTLVSRLAAADRLQSGRLVALPLAQGFPRQLRLAWHKQKYHGALLRRFIAFCQAPRG